MKIFVILPAYNEAGNLPPLLQAFGILSKIANLPFKIIVVDDGSTDETARIALQFNLPPLDLVVESHVQNLGLGPAFRTGFQKVLAEGKENDLVLTMDADNSHSPALIPQMISKLLEGHDVVIASRYQEFGQEVGLSLKRKWLSRICNTLLRVWFRVPQVKDYTCGYRLFRFPVLSKVAQKTNNEFVAEKTFVCSAEFLLNLSDAGASCAEVPLVLRYDLKKGSSKMKILPTIFSYFKLLLSRSRI